MIKCFKLLQIYLIGPIVFLRDDHPASMSIPRVLHSDVTSVIKSFKNKKSNANEIPVAMIIKENCELKSYPTIYNI